MILMEHYVTMIEAARLLSLSKQRLSQLYRGGKLPEPDAMVNNKPAWKVETLERWQEQRAKGF